MFDRQEQQRLLPSLPSETKGHESDLIDEVCEAIRLLQKRNFLKTERGLSVASITLLTCGIVFLAVRAYLHLSEAHHREQEIEQQSRDDWQHTPAQLANDNTLSNTTCTDYFAAWNATTIEEVSSGCTAVLEKSDVRYRGFQECLKIIDTFCDEKNSFRLKVLFNTAPLALLLVALGLVAAFALKLKSSQQKILPKPNQSIADLLTVQELEKVETLCHKLGIPVEKASRADNLAADLEQYKMVLAQQMLPAYARGGKLNI